MQEWRYTFIRLYTPREDLLFTTKKLDQLTTRTLCAILVTLGSIAQHPPYAATNLDWRPLWLRCLLGWWLEDLWYEVHKSCRQSW